MKSNNIFEEFVGQYELVKESKPLNKFLFEKYVTVEFAKRGNEKYEEKLEYVYDRVIIEAEKGNKDAQYFIADYYYSNENSKNYSELKAFKWFIKAAESGVVDAQIDLAWLYVGKEDYEQAFEWFLKVAKQGVVDAQMEVADAYFYGRGVNQDYIRTYEWVLKAAEQGDIPAQNNIGYLFYNGLGVTQDYKQAFEWFEKAAQKGSYKSQFYLGVIYEKGQGVTKNYDNALWWYRKAAEQGNTEAKNSYENLQKNKPFKNDKPSKRNITFKESKPLERDINFQKNKSFKGDMKMKEPSEYTLPYNNQNLKKFKLIKIRGGISPAIITIDGFLSENDDDIEGWKSALELKYTKNAWYHLEWESQSIKKLGIDVILGLTFFGFTRSIPLINMIPLPFGFSGLLKNWSKAMEKSDRTGELLSKTLNSCKLNDYILMGHSLGSRVILSCLHDLSSNNNIIINEVHLLGGAVTCKSSQWDKAGEAIHHKVFNYYSKRDRVLQTVYKAGNFEFNNPIGRTKIVSIKAVNIDVTKKVNGHTEFKEKFKDIIK